MKNITALIAVFLLALTWTQTARAQETSDEQAQRLQAVFQQLLTERQEKIAADTKHPRTLELEGDVTVETAETHYAITLPRMSIKYQDGSHIDIGIIALNASPYDKPGEHKMTMAVPTPILGFDANGNETMRIRIGQQKAAGIWDEILQNFTKLDAVYKDIHISMNNDAATIDIPEFRANYNLNQTDTGRWSGPIQFDLLNMSMNSAYSKTRLSLGALSIQSNLDEFSAEALRPGPKEGAIPDLKFADGADLSIAIKNLDIAKNTQSDTPETLSIGDADIGFSFDDALTGVIDANFDMNFNGLKASNVPDDLIGLLPQNGKLALTHHNIPLGQIGEALSNTGNGEFKMLGLAMLLKVPALFAQAGSYIELSESNINNVNYDINMNSIIRSDMTAANSFTAESTLKFAGLDKVLSMAQVAGTDLNSSVYAKPMRTLARYLERLKPVARIQTDEKWGFVHIFDLKMTQDGQFTINGQNSRFIFGDTPTPPEPAPTPPVEEAAPSDL